DFISFGIQFHDVFSRRTEHDTFAVFETYGSCYFLLLKVDPGELFVFQQQHFIGIGDKSLDILRLNGLKNLSCIIHHSYASGTENKYSFFKKMTELHIAYT